MDQDNSSSIPTDVTSLGGKSWTAYVGVVFAGLVLLLITPLAWLASPFIGGLVLIINVLMVGYRLMVLKSYHLYFDDIGVWVYSGVLPWNKGVAGVKWRDLDEAVYFQSLGSWLFKSYSIRIGHRFTKSSEILLSDWRRGNEVAMQINEYHQRLVRSNALG